MLFYSSWNIADSLVSTLFSQSFSFDTEILIVIHISRGVSFVDARIQSEIYSLGDPSEVMKGMWGFD